MANYSIPLDQVFFVLGDPTRLTIVSRLGAGAASVTELAAPFAMALPSLMKHLRILERSGLIRSNKQGRVRMCELQPRILQAAEKWIAERRAMWEARTDRLAAHVEALYAKENTDGRKR